MVITGVKNIEKRVIASFEYGGIKRDLSLDGMVYDSESRSYSANFERGLKVSLIFSGPNGCGPNGCQPNGYTWLLRFANTGAEDTLQIKKPRTLDIVFDAPRAVWHSLKGDSCAAESFLPLDKEFGEGDSLSVQPNGGRSSCTTGFPYFDIDFGSTAVIAAIGWSGQWRYDIKYENGECRISAGIANADFYLKPGETVRGPSVFIAEGDGGVSSLRRGFRHVIMEYFSPAARLKDELTIPLSIQPYDRYFYGRCPGWPTVAGQLRTIEGAKRCGGYIDTLWLDAAWFRNGFPNGVGNFSFAEGFPDGLREVSDAARKNGMKFMLWFEPERIYKGSEIYEGHPAFLLSVRENDDTKLFNLSDPAAADWLYNTLSEFIEMNGIDCYRQDFNMSPLQYWLKADGEGRVGVTEMKYIAGLYRLWDRLIEKFPKLFIDNCSSGGRRIDFETCKRSVPMWRSDTGCFPAASDKHTYTWNQNQTLCLTEYLPFHATASWVPDTYEVRSAMSEGLACTFDVLNEKFDFENAGRALEEVNRLRRFWRGDFYKLTEATLDETGWAAYQFALGDEGFCAFFRRNGCGNSEMTFALNAVCESGTYEIRLTGDDRITSVRTVKGAELAGGIKLTIPDKPGSLILEYKKA